MSTQNKTIEVRRCDFCISESEARACQHCNKDACAGCGRFYKLISDYWNPNPIVLTIGSRSSSTFSGFICHDCATNELPTIMLRFGFDGEKSLKSKTA